MSDQISGHAQMNLKISQRLALVAEWHQHYLALGQAEMALGLSEVSFLHNGDQLLGLE